MQKGHGPRWVAKDVPWELLHKAATRDFWKCHRGGLHIRYPGRKYPTHRWRLSVEPCIVALRSDSSKRETLEKTRYEKIVHEFQKDIHINLKFHFSMSFQKFSRGGSEAHLSGHMELPRLALLAHLDIRDAARAAAGPTPIALTSLRSPARFR